MVQLWFKKNHKLANNDSIAIAWKH